MVSSLPLGPLKVPGPEGFRADLLSSSTDLLDLTWDQLRTLIVVREAGTALAAARVLGREQSSVQKQLDILNRNFQALTGELLVVKQGRGKNFLFTPTGLEVVERARATFADWLQGIADSRRRLGSTLTVGTTEFTLGFLGRVWERVAPQLLEREVELKVVHVRTRDFWNRLDSNQVDLLCGGLAAEAAAQQVVSDYDFLEWHREGLALLTNLPVRELATKSVGVDRLRSLPLVIPSHGVITDFIERWYGPDFRSQLKIAAEIDDIYYGLALLRSRMTYGCMLCARSIGEAAVEGRLPTSKDFRLIDFADDFTPMLRLISGVFARKGERETYDASHPLNILWDAFRDEAASGRPLPL
ncbi:DNA-binding transcriptional regulator, LysR family [Streptomyces sp. DvalAA-14]|uniref:LysR family transcriptional regulator n=1 Tax=Streptomyces sp. SID4948 TaxID=2690287 RepID=UPI00081B23B6|nr:LysR family transcriptional regulator [Streptomyces sp. SID4948]SCE32720.1 DNA-binding transcriptional regulator, LysR family [Streptomyces sp. DvalAA-14]